MGRISDRLKLGAGSVLLVALGVSGILRQCAKLERAEQGMEILYSHRLVFADWMLSAWGVLFLLLAAVPLFWERDESGRNAPTFMAFAYGMAAILIGFLVGYCGAGWFTASLQELAV